MTCMNITIWSSETRNGWTLGTRRKAGIAGKYLSSCSCGLYFSIQQEAQLERKEQQMHNKATRAALHGNIGRAIHLEVTSTSWLA